MENLFSFDGRVDRQAYWTSAVVGFVVNAITLIVILFLADAESKGSNTSGLVAGTVVMSLVSLVVAISLLSFGVRRWHDLNKSGWWSLIGLVPFIGGLYALAMQGFVPGVEGVNDYGPPQRRGQNQVSTTEAKRYKEKVSSKRTAEIERKTVV